MSPRGLWEDEHDCAAIEEALGHAVQDADELRARVKRLEEALGIIADPIAHFRREAERRGDRLDGVGALLVACDPSWLMGVARAALKDTEGTP